MEYLEQNKILQKRDPLASILPYTATSRNLNALKQSAVEKKKILVQEKKVRDLNLLELVQDERVPRNVALDMMAQQKAEQQAERQQGKGKKKKKKETPFFVLNPLDKWFHFSMSGGGSPFNYEAQGSNLNLSINISPAKYFFISTSLALAVNSYTSPYYQPDFSYSFGYSDWHPDTIGFAYSNYANNKFIPEGNEDRFNFQQGTWEINYKNRYEKFNLFASLTYTPFYDFRKSKIKLSKTFWEKKLLTSASWEHYFHDEQERLILDSKYLITKKLFATATAYFYADYAKQTDLEPDYAYSIGWLDTRKYHPSITFSNYYTPTRWGGRDEVVGAKTKGTISFSIRF